MDYEACPLPVSLNLLVHLIQIKALRKYPEGFYYLWNVPLGIRLYRTRIFTTDEYMPLVRRTK